MDEWTSETFLEVRVHVCVCRCVCVTVPHSDPLGLLQASIHSCGKRRQTIGPVKISSQGHLSVSHKGVNERAGRGRDGGNRKEGRKGGKRDDEGGGEGGER